MDRRGKVVKKTLLAGMLAGLIGLTSAETASATTTTTGTHADPSKNSLDPVFTMTFAESVGTINNISVLTNVAVIGSYNERSGAPSAGPLILEPLGLSIASWDFRLTDVNGWALDFVAGYATEGTTYYNSIESGMFSYYEEGHAGDDSHLLYRGIFTGGGLVLPTSGPQASDTNLNGSIVNLFYGPAALPGEVDILVNPEQFAYAFANYSGQDGQTAGAGFVGSATASFTSSATVLPEPATVSLALLGLAALGTQSRRRRRS